MTFPEWTKPAIYGALGGAVAFSIIGFNFFGWTTSGNAQDMAQDFAKAEVTQAMLPVCLNMSTADPDREAKLASVNDASGFGRSKAMMDTGWATLPGTDSPSRDLANLCIEGLKLDGS